MRGVSMGECIDNCTQSRENWEGRNIAGDDDEKKVRQPPTNLSFCLMAFYGENVTLIDGKKTHE